MINEKYAKKFCKEDISKIENYDKAVNDTTQTWHCHHRTEIWWNCSKQDLIDNDCYNNRKACELIFLTPSEHLRLHNTGKSISVETRRKLSNRVMSDETRKKISNANIGKVLSEETRRKISNRVISDDTRKKMSDAHLGKVLSDKTKQKMSKAFKGKSWKVIDGKRVWLSKE